jgi:hypothetical protein
MATSSGLEPREITIELDKDETKFKAQPGRFRVDRRTGEMPDFVIRNPTASDAKVEFPADLVYEAGKPAPSEFIVKAGESSPPLVVNERYGVGSIVVEYKICMQLSGTRGSVCLNVEGGSRPGIEIRR